MAKLKAENQRCEKELNKQQARIDRLLDTSSGKAGQLETRKDIEKTSIVRQLKQQILNLRDTLSSKESELEHLKRSMKATRLVELSREKDEYFNEVIRLQKVVKDVKEELSIEKQRREWTMSLKGNGEEELRKEIARLTADYHNLLYQFSASRAEKSSGSSESKPTVNSVLNSALSIKMGLSPNNKGRDIGGPGSIDTENSIEVLYSCLICV